jgi:hypothetical protein
MSFELIWEPRGVYRRHHGQVTIAERRHSFDLICGDARFDGLRYAITGCFGVDSYEITEEATEEATEEIAALHIGPLRINPRIFIATVAVDERIIAAVRHFIALGFTTQPYRLFATLAEARACAAEQDVGQRPLRV